MSAVADDPSSGSPLPLGSTSEVGRLRSVMLHRPGDELRRLTPRNSDQLLFDGLPWVARAQEEHDEFADLLRANGVEVLLLGDLLTETIAHSGAARIQGIAAAVSARPRRSIRFMAKLVISSIVPDRCTRIKID